MPGEPRRVHVDARAAGTLPRPRRAAARPRRRPSGRRRRANRYSAMRPSARGADAEVEVGAERPGDLAPEELADASRRLRAARPRRSGTRTCSRGSRRRAGRPPRLLRRERHVIRSQSYMATSRELAPDAGRPARCASSMRTVTSRLARGGELGPVARHRRVEVDLPALHEHQHAERPPSPCRPRRRPPACRACHGRVRASSIHPPQRSTTGRPVDGCHRRAELAALAEVARERLAHRREALVAGALDLGAARTVTASRSRSRCGCRPVPPSARSHG